MPYFIRWKVFAAFSLPEGCVGAVGGGSGEHPAPPPLGHQQEEGPGAPSEELVHPPPLAPPARHIVASYGLPQTGPPGPWQGGDSSLLCSCCCLYGQADILAELESPPGSSEDGVSLTAPAWGPRAGAGVAPVQLGPGLPQQLVHRPGGGRAGQEAAAGPGH